MSSSSTDEDEEPPTKYVKLDPESDSTRHETPGFGYSGLFSKQANLYTQPQPYPLGPSSDKERVHQDNYSLVSQRIMV